MASINFDDFVDSSDDYFADQRVLDIESESFETLDPYQILEFFEELENQSNKEHSND